MKFWIKIFYQLTFILTCVSLSACGFHLQGDLQLAKPLHRMYLKSPDPYGYLARSLENYLIMSNVQLVSSPDQATTILDIINDSTSQSLLSVSGTQQTRQYNLIVNVTFVISDSHGNNITQPQSLAEARTITIQSNQILGSSNEAAIIYQQIRRSLASAIMNRLSSQEITHAIDDAFKQNTNQYHVTQGKHKKL